MTDRPALITDAAPSYDEQLSKRRRRYVLMMLLRIPFLIGAGATYQIPWLAIGLILLSVPLPWMAVLLANDGPARNAKPKKVLPGTISFDRQLESYHHVIDVDDDSGSDAAGAERPADDDVEGVRFEDVRFEGVRFEDVRHDDSAAAAR